MIEIWRKASQSAAEEVYSGVRDRVNGMGGLQAWRQREKDKFGGNAETAWGWDENERKRNDDECEDEADDHEDEESKEEEEQEEEEGFTMDMMLKSLNIELGLIGYDKEAQRWKE